jgi:hypothetical protein
MFDLTRLATAGVAGLALTAGSAVAGSISSGPFLLDGFGDLDTIAPVLAGETDSYVLTDTDIPVPTTVEVSVVGVAGTSFSVSVPDTEIAVFSTTADPFNPGQFILTYNFSAPVDFSLVSKFTFEKDAVDVLGLEYDFELTDNNGNKSTLQDSYSGGDAVLSFFLSNFTLEPGFDISAVTSLKATVTSSVGDDFIIDNFAGVAVPSPTAAGAGLFGLTALVLRRRK